MRNKKLELCTVLLLVLGLTGLHAQVAIPASGGVATGSGGSISYSIGQVIYTTNTGTNGSVTQGVQQPYKISATTGFDEANGITLKCNAYPNPVSDYLILSIENYEKVNLSYQLYDINGQLLENKKLTGNKNTISMLKFVSANYILKVVDNQEEIKSFRIIKN